MEKSRNFSNAHLVALTVSFLLNIYLIVYLIFDKHYYVLGMSAIYTILIGMVITIAIFVTLIVVTQLSMKENNEHIRIVKEATDKQQTMMNEVLKISDFLESSYYHIFETIESISESKKMVSGAVQNIAQATKKVDISVEKKKALTADIQKLIEQIDTLSRKMNKISIKTNKKIELGNMAMKKLSDKTELASENNDRVYKTILDMEDSMLEIQQLVKTINNISSRISVISVNATIESTRADEVGIGFSIAVDEIRKLSSQTKMAVIKMTEVIGSLNVKMAMCSASMENFQGLNKLQTDLIGEVVEIFKETNVNIDQVKESVEKVSENMSNILKANIK